MEEEPTKQHTHSTPGPLRGGSGGKLPRAPRQRRGPVIPQNEFFYRHLGWKQKLIIQIFNFSQLCDDVSSTIEQLFCHYHCAAHALYLLYFEEMNDPCDFVQFSYYGVILLSVISYHFSGMHKKLSVLLNKAKIAALGRALSDDSDEWRQRIFYSWVRQPAGGPVSVIPRALIWLSTGLLNVLTLPA